MGKLFSDKRVFFAIFGAIGGYISAVLYGISGVDDNPFTSWVIGTGFDGMCVGAALALAQGRYLGKSFDFTAIKRALRVGGGGGMAGGLVGFIIMMSMMETSDAAMEIARYIGWAIGGLAVGFALSKVVPNLNTKTASIAGAIGGFVGCFFMGLMGSMAAGTASTGAAIGIAIALAETASRRAWLEVTIRPKGLSLEKERTVSVSLGEKPVVFGCAADADVKLAEVENAGGRFAEVSVAGSRIVFKDLLTEQTRDLAVDETFEVSNAKIVVRNKEVAAADVTAP